MDIEEVPADMRAVRGHMIPSVPATRRIRYFFFAALAFPWAWFLLHIIHGYSLFLDITAVALVFGLAYLSSLWVEYETRRAIYGRILHSYFEKLLIEEDLRTHWNQVAEKRCPQAKVKTADELKPVNIDDLF